jgi:hypothetical protein
METSWLCKDAVVDVVPHVKSLVTIALMAWLLVAGLSTAQIHAANGAARAEAEAARKALVVSEAIEAPFRSRFSTRRAPSL